MSTISSSARARAATRIAALLFTLALLAAPTHAALARSLPAFISEPPAAAFPQFEEFVRAVADGEAGVLSGVYHPIARTAIFATWKRGKP